MNKIIFSIKNNDKEEGTPYIVSISNSPNESGEFISEILDNRNVKIFSNNELDYNTCLKNLKEKVSSLGKIIIYAGNLRKLDDVTKKIIDHLYEIQKKE
jgi:hypothetical protein